MLRTDIVISENLDELLTRFSLVNDCSLIIHCISGKLQIEINEQQFVIGPDDMLLCRADLIVGNYMRSPDMQCFVIAIRKHALDDILYVCMREDGNWWEKSNYIISHPVVHLGERQKKIVALFAQLYDLYREDERTGHAQNIRDIFVQMAILELLSWVEEGYKETLPEVKQGRPEVLFRDFVRLLQTTKGREREVQWYASQLAISPKYLSAVSNVISGKSAMAIINDVVTQEIKRLLRHTDLSIKEIYVQMNFPSLSFFCKYVKRHLGMTANQYRKTTV